MSQGAEHRCQQRSGVAPPAEAPMQISAVQLWPVDLPAIASPQRPAAEAPPSYDGEVEEFPSAEELDISKCWD